MNTRGLPGTFAPMYQEFALLRRYVPAAMFDKQIRKLNQLAG
jgi:hypothetical protein